MFFKKYQIVIFKDKLGSCRRTSISGFTILFLVLTFIGLAATNVYLWQHHGQNSLLEQELAQSEQQAQEQQTQILNLSDKLDSLEKDLTRIRDFDSKLKAMINLEDSTPRDRDTSEAIPEADFSKNYLPLYRQEMLARKMHDFLRKLREDARLEEVSQQDLIERFKSDQSILEATPSIWPTNGWVSSPFGWRDSPFTTKREFHKGMDITAPRGTPIYAPARGRVLAAGQDASYGTTVKLQHSPSLQTRYAHMQRSAVKKGQQVARGEIIGYVGNTGRSTGPHLHYEVRLNGVPVNPDRYILN
ncbi:MAG: M23 family metallopeptidase [Desulfovibrio sp.]